MFLEAENEEFDETTQMLRRFQNLLYTHANEALVLVKCI